MSKRLESGRSALVIIEGEHCCEMDGKLPFGQYPCVVFATLREGICLISLLEHHSSLIVRGRLQIGGLVKSPVVKRSIVLDGHKTSVSLEDAFWKGLKDIAARRVMTLSDLVGSIDARRQQNNLSSALRLFVLDYYRSQAAEAKGHDGPSDVPEGPKSLLA